MSESAIRNLREHQRQLDEDGVLVGVSRQALDETLSAYDQLRAELEAERARVIDLMMAGSNLSVAVENIEGDLEGVDLRVVHDMADQMDEAIARTTAQSRAEIEAGALELHAKRLEEKRALMSDLAGHPNERVATHHARMSSHFDTAISEAEGEAARIRSEAKGDWDE